MKSFFPWPSLGASLLVLIVPAVAHAGMPMVTLTDVAASRLDTISFFLAAFLLSAFFVKLLWNYLRKDFPILPYLGYGRAVGLTAMWGLLFVLVLTMISGARELMTPGAWEKQGLTYKLADTSREATPPDEDQLLEQARIRKLEQLRFALWNYATSHDRNFPADQKDTAIPAEVWQTPDASAMRYLYVPGLQPGQGAQPLAYEPELFGPERMVLLSDGTIRRMTLDEILLAAAAKEKP